MKNKAANLVSERLSINLPFAFFKPNLKRKWNCCLGDKKPHFPIQTKAFRCLFGCRFAGKLVNICSKSTNICPSISATTLKHFYGFLFVFFFVVLQHIPSDLLLNAAQRLTKMWNKMFFISFFVEAQKGETDFINRVCFLCFFLTSTRVKSFADNIVLVCA